AVRLAENVTPPASRTFPVNLRLNSERGRLAVPLRGRRGGSPVTLSPGGGASTGCSSSGRIPCGLIELLALFSLGPECFSLILRNGPSQMLATITVATRPPRLASAPRPPAS